MAERRPSLQHLLGKTVTVQIDRPIGSIHPRHPELTYPIHYGFVPGIIGGDGEPQDAYLIGVDAPVSEYIGKVIGIVRRLNDREDKLVVAPDGICFHQAQIESAVHFQERYFRTRIIPLYHRSCGAIIYRKDHNHIRYLLLFQRGSHTWSFPKGHMERNESEEETALREVQEEVGMQIRLRQGFRGEASYSVGIGEKTVVLFLAKATNPPVLSSQEVLTSRWVTLQDAEKLLHVSYMAVLRNAEAFLMQKNDSK
ncbi:MAG: NUDIX domain-containing protein [Clostridia bacterium]|nr:NUDIX domain-containing protein [Clostridia bacterium]